MNDTNNQHRIIHLPETGSTNIYLRKLIDSGQAEDGCVVWSDFQTAGRGQMGTHWESERNVNLTFSIAHFPQGIPAKQQFAISEVIALSVKEALSFYASDIRIKWPNDIYWHDRKICGILIEVGLDGTKVGFTVSGIGINVNQTKFRNYPTDPVSLYLITHKIIPLEEVLDRFLLSVDGYIARLNSGNIKSIHRSYLSSLYRASGFHKYKDKAGIFEATISAVEPDGHLLLRLSDGSLRRYAFKEVSYIIRKK